MCKILAWSIEDTIDLYFFSSIIDEYFDYQTTDALKHATCEFAKNIIESGFVRAGDLLDDNTFIPWKQSLGEIIYQIKTQWNSLDHKLYPQELVWFEVTEKGRLEFDRLNAMPELDESNPYIRICQGGVQAAEEMFNKLTKDAKLIKSDNLKIFKVYVLEDNTFVSYRKKSKTGVSTIDVQFSEINKTIQFQYVE